MGVFSGFANSVLTMTASGKHIIANAGIAIAGKIFGKAGFERFDSLPTELAHPANVGPILFSVGKRVSLIPF